MTVCIVHVLESDRNPDNCPDCIIQKLKERLHAYDKALFEISGNKTLEVDGVEHTTFLLDENECREVARMALEMDPLEFLEYMQDPPQ